jgi:phosphate:Na+ symporter
VLFSLTVGLLAMLALGPLSAAGNWVGTRLGDPEGVLALAAFSTIFKLAGIVVFYPFLERFAQFVTRICGDGRETAVAHLDPRIAEAGGSVALEAAYRAALETAQGAADAIRRRLTGESVRYDPPTDAVQQVTRFLETLSLETTDLGTIAPRLVRLTHALDHLTELHGDFAGLPPVPAGWQPSEASRAGAEALAAWLAATADPAAAPDTTVHSALESAAKTAATERDAGRRRLLEDLALQRVSADTARSGIDTLNWTAAALHHAWRLTDSLRIAADQ